MAAVKHFSDSNLPGTRIEEPNQSLIAHLGHLVEMAGPFVTTLAWKKPRNSLPCHHHQRTRYAAFRFSRRG
jgi:hypothetical protein